MEVFSYVLILLAAVLLSNLINHFVPVLSVPLVQIFIGVCIDIIPYGALGFEFDLEPDLFFILFLSPLVFHSARTADLKTMRRLISPIILAAVGLVLLTVFAVGFFANMLLPSIPLVAAFALAAALGPTDIVAVEAVAHRIAVPKRIESILTGESIINDATGLVCFQFVIVAATTGTFNVLQGPWRFLIVSLGGLLVGIVITIVKFLLVRWLRSLNIVTASLHIALGIMTPFIIYMVAEWLGTSGILAVFSSGIGHALYKDKFNPEIVILNNATESVWSVLTFNLDGLVFVMLGTQLPRILKLEVGWASGFGGRQLVVFVLLIYLALAVTRFFWWILTVRRKTYNEADNPIGSIRAGMIFAVAGARGTVSMASILSIPLLLDNGAAFPERELIILITCGVITVSMLMTNFVLPLIVKKSAHDANFNAREHAARAEILRTVIERLKRARTPENYAATEIIVHHYNTRLNKHLLEKTSGKQQRAHLKNVFLQLEKNVYLHMAESGQISEAKTDHYIGETKRLDDESKQSMGVVRTFWWMFSHLYTTVTWKEPKLKGRELKQLKDINAKQMKKIQAGLNLAKNDPAMALIAAEHEKVVSARNYVPGGLSGDMANEVVEVAQNGLYLERVLIQQMMDEKRLSPKTAKEMQANIIMLEAQLQTE
jgi:CPA1 family monovalent cation:H+ antiporter